MPTEYIILNNRKPIEFFIEGLPVIPIPTVFPSSAQALDKARSQAPSKNYRLAYGVVHCSGAGGSLSGGDSIASQDRTLLDDDSPLLETLQRHKRSQTCNFYLIPRADDTGNDVPEVTLVRDHEMMSEV